MRFVTAALTVLLVVPLSTISAQQPPPLEVGSLVRVTSDCRPGRSRADCRMEIGVLEAATADSVSLRLLDGGYLNAWPLASVTRLEVSRGRKSNGGTGALYGFMAGFGVGAIWGGIAGEGYMGDAHISAAGSVVFGGLYVGAIGAIGGLLVGTFIKTDRWEEVPLDRLQVSLAPQRNGVSFGLRIAF
jgi:hypothetical protein